MIKCPFIGSSLTAFHSLSLCAKPFRIDTNINLYKYIKKRRIKENEREGEKEEEEEREKEKEKEKKKDK